MGFREYGKTGKDQDQDTQLERVGHKARKRELNLIVHTPNDFGVARGCEIAALKVGHTHAPNRYCQTTDKTTCVKKGVHTRVPFMDDYFH